MAEVQGAEIAGLDELDTRGHITITLEGQDYVLRPSYEALVAIEASTGKSHEQLAHEAVRFQLSYVELALVCVEMFRAQGKADPKGPLASTYKGIKAERLQSMIYEEGKAKVTTRVAIVLAGALSGGYTSSGEVKATETVEATPVAD